jgi:DNA end-binding protein Ku
MPRPLWSGSLNFGLVNVPVRLMSAVRDLDLHFHQLHASDDTPIETRRVCSEEGEEVPYEDIGNEYEDVILTDAELAAADPKKTKTIEIESFVRLEEVDPIYFDRTYFLVPAGAEAQRRPYALLLEAMKDAEVAALGRFMLAGKEKLCLIRPMGEALALETLFVHEDVRDHDEIDEAVAASEVRAPELNLAKQIIDSLAGPFEPTELRSEYRESLREMLEAKLQGVELEAPVEATPAPFVDLMEARKASVAAASKKEPAAAKKKAAPRKRAAASK